MSKKRLAVEISVLAMLLLWVVAFFDRFGNYRPIPLVSSALGLIFSFWLSFRAFLGAKSKEELKIFGRSPFFARAIIFLLLFGWWIMRPGPPMGQGPAGPPVDAKKFEQIWKHDAVHLISIGDSVSTGFGAPVGEGFPLLMIDNVNSVFPEMEGRDLRHVFPRLKFFPKASNSSNSFDHLSRIEGIEKRGESVFGIVTMTTGGIDLLHKYGKASPKEGAMYGATWEQARPWIDNFEARLESMVTHIKSLFPGGAAVFVATIYDPTDGIGDVENAGPMFWLPKWEDGLGIHTAFNQAIRDVASRHDFVHVADVHKTMLGHGIHATDPQNPNHNPNDPGYWYYVNLEDPNVRGHDAIRRCFLNAMADVFADK